MNPSDAAHRQGRLSLADDRGVSAVEFALIFPVILLLLAGMVEINEALTVHRKLRQVSSTVSDLIAQQSLITPAQVDLTLGGAASMLLPYDTTNLQIVLSLIDVSEEGQTIAWSRGYHAAAEHEGAVASFEVPATLAVAGSQIVAVKVDYSFRTAFSNLFEAFFEHSGYAMQDRMYERPRLGDSIEFDD